MDIKKIRKFYRNHKWIEFSDKIKERDGNKCINCSRKAEDVVLQVHHTTYYENKKPWEYANHDCITLCKGCHAREHNLIEPNYGWLLISIDDLGGLDGICERKNCNTAIRYEHIAYHPKWGYKTVGSSCISFLTEEDKFKSRQYIYYYKKIAKALDTFEWEKDETKKGRYFIFVKYKKSTIRIYEDNSSYQLAFKKLPLEKPIQPFNQRIQYTELIKELALIHLMGIISKDKNKEEELNILQDIYKNLRSSIRNLINKENKK